MTNTTTALKSSNTAKSRNRHLDVVKGFAIISMVLAHCGFPYTSEIYLFHMALFFMASGYFYSDRNAKDLRSVGIYIGKKILSLYVPYVLFNGLLVLLHNWFIEINLMTNDPLFQEIGGFGAVWGLQWPYDKAFQNEVLKRVLLFAREPQLGGATWFMRALFVVSIFNCVFMWLVSKLRYKPLQITAIASAVILCIIVATRISKGQSNLAESHKSYFAGWLAYLLGIVIRKKEHLFRYDLQSGLFSAVLLYLMKNYGSVSLNVGWFPDIAFYAVASLLGWILLRSMAEVLHGVPAKFIAYAGNHSMSIMMLHFLSFKLVTLAVILLRGDNLLLLASFPQIDGGPAYLWIAYTAAGVCVPLVISMVYHKIKKKVDQAFRRIYENISNRSRRTTRS